MKSAKRSWVQPNEDPKERLEGWTTEGQGSSRPYYSRCAIPANLGALSLVRLGWRLRQSIGHTTPRKTILPRTKIQEMLTGDRSTIKLSPPTIDGLMSDLDNPELSTGKGHGVPEIQLSEANAIAERAGKDITQKFSNLAPHERRKVVAQFRRQLFPIGKPGRRRSKEITAAYADWISGMRGLVLYRKHIPGFDRMSIWKRKVKKSRTLFKRSGKKKSPRTQGPDPRRPRAGTVH